MQQLELEKLDVLRALDEEIGKLGMLSYYFYLNAIIHPFRDPKKSIPIYDRTLTRMKEEIEKYFTLRPKLKEVLEV